jgi:hypothetical protein
MTTLLSPLMRRLLALSILAAVVVLCWSLVVRPVIALSSDRAAEIEADTEQLDHLQLVIAHRPELERRANALHAQFAAAGGFWAGVSPAAIAASVQDRLRQAVTDSGGRVKSTSGVSETTEHGFRKLTVRFSIEGTLDTVQKTLAAVETATPALFVDSLKLAPQGRDADAETPPMLDLDLDVAGYMKAPPS